VNLPIGLTITRIVAVPFLILFLISSIGSGLAFSVVDLIVWRVIGGVGIGIASVVAPAYIAEISPRLMRGRLASLQQLAIVFGIFAALLSDALFANAAGGAAEPFWLGLDAWRWMFIACVVPSVVYGVLALTLPESPRYLVKVGKEMDLPPSEIYAGVLYQLGALAAITRAEGGRLCRIRLRYRRG